MIKQFISKFNNDWTANMAAALSYALLNTLLPLAVACLSIIGFIWGKNGTYQQEQFLHHAILLFPSFYGRKDIISTILKQLSSISGTLGILSFLLAIFSGSRLFIVIENAFDIIYQKPARKFFQQNGMAISMLVIFSICISLIVITSGIPSFLFTVMRSVVITHSLLLKTIITVVSIWILFTLLYIIIPNQKISFQNSWKGGLIATILLDIYLIIFPLYVKFFLKGYIGAIGFAIIILAFFYYFSLILLFGAEVNAFFSEGITKITGNINDLVASTANHEDADDNKVLPTNILEKKNISFMHIFPVITSIYLLYVFLKKRHTRK